MGLVTSLLNRLSNIFTQDTNSNLGQLMGAIGQELDKVDPAQTLLAQQFAMSTAKGSALDMHGKDWGVPRRLNESDSDYRSRIQAVLPIYTNGPTVSAISNIVQNFTGAAPILFEYGTNAFTMGYSTMGDFGFYAANDAFAFQITVNNPNGILYNTQDLEDAVNAAKPARSTAEFIHSFLIDGSSFVDISTQSVDGGSFADSSYLTNIDGGGW